MAVLGYLILGFSNFISLFSPNVQFQLKKYNQTW